jgi:predicted solute-binding protein
MLEANTSDIDLNDYRSQHCSQYKAVGSVSQKLFCNIGASLGKHCAPPLSTRNFFSSKLKDKTIGDPSSRNLNRALQHMAKDKMSLVFIGQ